MNILLYKMDKDIFLELWLLFFFSGFFCILLNSCLSTVK